MGNIKPSEKVNKISLKDYTIHQTLGLSKTSRVRLVSKINSKSQEEEYSVWKILCKDDIINYNLVDRIKNELIIHKSLDCLYITKLLGFNQTPGHLYFEIEFCSGGSLFDVIRKFKKLNEECALFYFFQILKAIEYCHNKKIIYRDLKPENCLITQEGNIKLTDFGTAKYIKDRTYSICGTTRYTAPEILLLWLRKNNLCFENDKIVTNVIDKQTKIEGYNFLVDYWSLGIILFEMLTGLDPFVSTDDMKVTERILTGKLKIPTYISKTASDLIIKLLKINPNDRLGSKNGIKEIFSHDFVANINKLDNKLIESYIMPESLITKNSIRKYDEKERKPKIYDSSDDPFSNW